MQAAALACRFAEEAAAAGAAADYAASLFRIAARTATEWANVADEAPQAAPRAQFRATLPAPPAQLSIFEPVVTDPQDDLLSLLDEVLGWAVDPADVEYSARARGSCWDGQVTLAPCLGGASYRGRPRKSEVEAHDSAAVAAAAAVAAEPAKLRHAAARAAVRQAPARGRQRSSSRRSQSRARRARSARSATPAPPPWVRTVAHQPAEPDGFAFLAQPDEPALPAMPSQFDEPGLRAQPAGNAYNRSWSRQRKPSQDLSWPVGISPPYLVTTKDHMPGYKVHVGDLPAQYTYAQRVEWINATVRAQQCPVPDDYGPALGCSPKVHTTQMILTYKVSEHAQRAQKILDRVRIEGAVSNSRFWLPWHYDAWASDPRFHSVPRNGA